MNESGSGPADAGVVLASAPGTGPELAAAISGGPERHIETTEHAGGAVAGPHREVRADGGRQDDGACAAGEVDRLDGAAVPLDGEPPPVG